MIRLLIVVAIIALTVYFTVFTQKNEEKPQVIYQESVDKAEGVEQQVLDAAEKQREDIDKLTQ